MEELNSGSLKEAAAAMAIVVAAIVTLLNAGAIRTWLEQRARKMEIAADHDKAILLTDDALARLARAEAKLLEIAKELEMAETQLNLTMLEERQCAVRLEGMTATVARLQGEVEKLEAQHADTHHQNEKLKELLSRRGGWTTEEDTP